MDKIILKNSEDKMKKSVDKIKEELAHMRTGRPSPALLEQIKVDYYGVPTPVNQMATVNVAEERTLVIKPWDKSTLSLVEKAILSSNLGINPANDGISIKLNFPIPTTEQRKKWVKTVKDTIEEGKIAVRNIRREANKEAKDAENEKEITEDQLYKLEDEVQKQTDVYCKKIDELYEKKRKEIMDF
jgi:ribosome recycling factor